METTLNFIDNETTRLSQSFNYRRPEEKYQETNYEETKTQPVPPTSNQYGYKRRWSPSINATYM